MRKGWRRFVEGGRQKSLVAICVIAAVATGSAVEAESPNPPEARQAPFFKMQRSRSLIYITDRIEVAFQGSIFASPPMYRLDYTWEQWHPKGNTIRRVWFDSESCPAARVMLEGIGKAHLLTPDPAAASAPPAVDGTIYSLESPASGRGHISMSSNEGTALAQWMNSAFDSLATCIAKGHKIEG